MTDTSSQSPSYAPSSAPGQASNAPTSTPTPTQHPQPAAQPHEAGAQHHAAPAQHPQQEAQPQEAQQQQEASATPTPEQAPPPPPPTVDVSQFPVTGSLLAGSSEIVGWMENWGVTGLDRLENHDKSAVQAALDAVHQSLAAFGHPLKGDAQAQAFPALKDAIAGFKQQLSNLAGEAVAQGHNIQPAIENVGVTIENEALSIGQSLGL